MAINLSAKEGIGERRASGDGTIFAEGIELLGQNEFDPLLARFVTLLARHGLMQAASVVMIESALDTIAFTRKSCEALDGGPILPLDDALVSSLFAQLVVVARAQTDYLKGVTPLCLGAETYGLVLFGPLAKGGVLFAFRWAPNRPAEVEVDFLARQAQEVYRWQQQLTGAQELIYKDDLTGVYNYRYLEVALETEIRRAQRFQMNFALLFIDLDNFKPINDRYGHLSGSLVLKQVATILTEGLREVDSVFRYGGDEYVVLLLGAGSASGYLAAERIRSRLALQPFRTEGGDTVYITASIGVAAYPEHASDREALIKIADQCMYQSKHGGKNRVVVMGLESTATHGNLSPLKADDHA